MAVPIVTKLEWRLRAEAAEATLAQYRAAFALCEVHTPDLWEGDGTCVICEAVNQDDKLKAADARLAQVEAEYRGAFRTAEELARTVIEAKERAEAAEARCTAMERAVTLLRALVYIAPENALSLRDPRYEPWHRMLEEARALLKQAEASGVDGGSLASPEPDTPANTEGS
jgi:hypothetical protein